MSERRNCIIKARRRSDKRMSSGENLEGAELLNSLFLHDGDKSGMEHRT